MNSDFLKSDSQPKELSTLSGAQSVLFAFLSTSSFLVFLGGLLCMKAFLAPSAKPNYPLVLGLPICGLLVYSINRVASALKNSIVESPGSGHHSKGCSKTQNNSFEIGQQKKAELAFKHELLDAATRTSIAMAILAWLNPALSLFIALSCCIASVFHIRMKIQMEKSLWEANRYSQDSKDLKDSAKTEWDENDKSVRLAERQHLLQMLSNQAKDQADSIKQKIKEHLTAFTLVNLTVLLALTRAGQGNIGAIVLYLVLFSTIFKKSNRIAELIANSDSLLFKRRKLLHEQAKLKRQEHLISNGGQS